jgi:Zn-finger nucleic acid-binding protein
VLTVSHRHGIEVEHCPTCRGVWLDRGELEHLVESVAERLGPPARTTPPPPTAGSAPAGGRAEPPRPSGDDRRDPDRRRGDQRGRRKRRKHSVLDLLEDVLDF